MKIALAADFHFGVHGRLSDILWAARVIREYCRAAGIDVVVILGDLFNDRKSLDIEVICAVIKFFEETADEYGQQWIVFPGNHDMFLRNSWQMNSLTTLRRHLTVIEDLKILELDDRRFWVLPFIQYEKSFMRVLRKLEYQHREGDILLTHVGVRGATLNTCFLLKDWSIVNFDDSKFEKIYTGHFHSKQSVNDKVFYPGSPIPFKFDEGDVAHGFYVHDLETSAHKFVNIWKAGAQLLPAEKAPPQFTTFNHSVLNQKTPADIGNNIVRIILDKEYTVEEKREIKEHLVQLGAISVRWMNQNQKLERTPDQIAPVGPQRNFFKAWLESDEKGIKDLDVRILNRVHDDVVQEGDEVYAVEESEV